MTKTLNCLICRKEVYSGLGNGCKMCGMLLEKTNENFCCRLCMRKYNTINKNKRFN